VPVNLGPGRQIVSQDSPDGVSRLGGQAGTQAPDPTPLPSQDQGSRAGSTIHTLPADSAETAFCALTSAATLLGVGLNAWAGWWWADPAAGLIIAALAVKEGLEAWEDDE
jgi:hypothetical protein